VTIQLLRLISQAIAGLRTPPENKKADEYLRAELLHLVLHFAALDGHISEGEAKVYGEIATAIDSDAPVPVADNVSFLKQLMEVLGKEELRRPHSLGLVEQFDQENKTDWKMEARDAFFQIALAVASADGLPSAAVKTELLRFAQILGQTGS
jgi:tellurite resistance protein